MDVAVSPEGLQHVDINGLTVLEHVGGCVDSRVVTEGLCATGVSDSMVPKSLRNRGGRRQHSYVGLLSDEADSALSNSSSMFVSSRGALNAISILEHKFTKLI